MKRIFATLLAAPPAFAFAATIVDFDSDVVGALPPGWTIGSTGGGSPKWSVQGDSTTPSPPNVLKQLGTGTFSYDGTH